MGFNNYGAAALARRVMLPHARDLPAGVVIGVNIGRARGTPDERAADDYLDCHRPVAPVADYVAVNVSTRTRRACATSRNPPRSRTCWPACDAAGGASSARPPLARQALAGPHPTALEALVSALLGTPAAGVDPRRTPPPRAPALRLPRRDAEARRPLRRAAPATPRWMRSQRARGSAGAIGWSIIASGGIGSAARRARLSTPARTCVQLWTGLVYRGPGLIGEAVRASA